ncbi:DUF2207 family protein [Halobacillus salinarum]|uniref:DUF2207 family protein n=1 Tax=Halobacillus salinarum TaxID=2932257 RepID=UPI0037C06B85
MGTVPDGKNGDIRAAYPPSLFPQASSINEGTILDDMKDDKLRLEEQAAAKQTRTKLLQDTAPYAAGLTILVAIGLFIFAYRNHVDTKRELERKPVTFDQMSIPATISFINSGVLTPKSLTAALLDLVYKGYVKKVTETQFSVVNRNTEHKHESVLIQWLFDEIGNGNTFTMNDLKAYTKKKGNHSKYRNNFSSWKRSVQEEAAGHHLYQRQGKLRWVSAIAGILLLPLAITFIIYGLLPWMLFSIFMAVLLLAFAVFYRPKTVKGLSILKEWKSDNHLQEEQENIPLTLVAIGSGRKSLPNQLSPSAPDSDTAVYVILAASLYGNFDDANQTVSAAGSGGAGAGGAGVGGGGGGSGAF